MQYLRTPDVSEHDDPHLFGPHLLIDRDGSIIYAYTDVDYRDRADPRDVLQVLTKKAVAA